MNFVMYFPQVHFFDIYFCLATVREKISCTYIGEKDVMVFSDSSSLSLRKDLNGMYFLDTALQGKMTEPANDVIKLELTLADV